MGLAGPFATDFLDVTAAAGGTFSDGDHEFESAPLRSPYKPGKTRFGIVEQEAYSLVQFLWLSEYEKKVLCNLRRRRSRA